MAEFLQSGSGSIIGTGRVVTVVRKSGEIFPIHLAVSDVTVETTGKTVRLFTGIIRDLTSQKRAESELLLDQKERETINQQGNFYLAQTRLRGRVWLRTTLKNPLTTREDLEALLSEIRAAS